MSEKNIHTQKSQQ